MNKQKPRRPAARLRKLPLATAIYLALGSAAAVQAAESNASALPAIVTTTIQTAADPAPADEAKADDGAAPTLETITVTSQKRSEDVQKVPISITVFST